MILSKKDKAPRFAKVELLLPQAAVDGLQEAADGAGMHLHDLLRHLLQVGVRTAVQTPPAPPATPELPGLPTA